MKKIGIIILAALLLMSSSVVAFADDSATISYEDLKYIAGDVDCNEAIEEADLAFLKTVLIKTEQVKREKAADTNKDGKINVLDLVHLNEYLSELG